MTKRSSRRQHDHFGERVTPSLEHQLRGSSLFDGGTDSDTPNVPAIRTEPPIAPGSESSRRGSEVIDPLRGALYKLVMETLAASRVPMSREEIAARTKVKESTLCGRLSELRPLWIEAVEGACVARSGVQVDGYRLTVAGKQRVGKCA